MLHSAESEEAKGIKRLLDKYRLSVGMLVAVPYLVVLEPIKRYEVNYINTVDEALKVLDAFPAENLKLLLDIFHMNIEEQSIVGAIRKAGDRIGHVHFVDSNRWPPGYGHLDLKEIYRQLVAVGYRGYIGLEALPEPDPETGARNGLGYVKVTSIDLRVKGKV